MQIHVGRLNDQPVELVSLDAVKTPDDMVQIVPGWEQLPRTPRLNETWWDDDEGDWQPVGMAVANDYVKSWVTLNVPDLSDARYLYRTHLELYDLQRIWTLFIRGPAIKSVIVNGYRITPTDTFYYSLNGALEEGENVIAIAPDEFTHRGLNMSLPRGTRERYVFMPELRSDRAPLVPKHPAFRACRMNRAFTVSTVQAQPGDTVLFAWPNDAPAIVARTVGGRTEIVAAPGIFDDLLPGPDIASQAMQGGSTTTVEYDYAVRQQQEGLGGDRIDQILPALISWAGKRPAITALTASASVASVRVESRDDFSGAVAWRILDWEGEIIGSGSAKVDVAAGKGASVSVPLPDLSDAKMPEGANLGCFVRVQAALLTADRRQVLACVDRHVEPNPGASVVLRPDEKLARLNAQTGSLARRVLHESIDQLPDSFVYLPGEPVTIRALMENNSSELCKASLNVEAVPAFSGKPVKKTVTRMILPFLQTVETIRIEPEQTKTEQPWSVTAELKIDGQPTPCRSTMSFVVAKPRGEIADFAKVTAQGHGAGGYMWQMSPHAWPMEHRAGTDAMHPETPGPWWLRCRESSDGNWIIAQGVHREDQGGLLWGAFYDQYRGEVVDSYGWFPNGQNFREWWAPYAMREVLRRNGRRPCIFALSDWWQYDAGYPEDHYATLQMFNEWLVANKGKRIAGTLLDGRPIQAGTMSEMRRTIADRYQHVFDFFIAQGLADCARFTGDQLEATAPGTTQMGQGCYAHRLPGTRGGSGIGPLWASYETTGILDADNHPFAGDWQYALESVAFRAIGVNNFLQTHWETPMRYHRVNDVGRHFVPLSPAQWRRRLLDSRWQTIADDDGRFQRVFNVTHSERLDGECELVEDGGKTRIGGGRLPYHWWIKDRLAALAMTIAP
ncbi:MAG TPA: hypothetical protein VMW48_11390, partial [Vicinamibacterales bacterium]|nr:hypothetical protein [Vicinamibacterales bacterium]